MKKDKKKKEPKRKPKYGFFSCVWYSLKLTWRTSKSVCVSAVAVIPVALILRAIGLYTPSLILERLETSDTFLTVVYSIGVLVAAQMIFSIVKKYIDIKRRDSEFYVLLQMQYEMDERVRYMDYDLQLQEGTEKIINRAKQAIENNHTDGIHFVERFADVLLQILSFVLFGSVVSMVSPWMLLLLVAGCLINYLCVRWKQKREWDRRDERNTLHKKMHYISHRVCNDLGYGKDIRLFHMSDFFDALIQRLSGVWFAQMETTERDAFLVSLVEFAVVLLRDGVTYGFLIWKCVNGEMDAAQFVLYFTAVTQISEFVAGILNTWSGMREGALQISDYREFYDIEDRHNRGPGIPLPEDGQLSVEFRNVSYQYPKGEKKVLDNVSFRINPGEKIALVGANGAGKTTLTMLMCGLLLPDAGEIWIGGHEIREYNRDELYTLFSLVPQKYSLMPVSIAENIAVVERDAGEDIDYEKLKRCIQTAGLEKKIAELPLGIETPLNRQLHLEATELSGGEAQKLLLARAMYRDARILILDEPTAALDPIAEDEMYRKYNAISKDKTSVFISHRLASTRFCDRILFLDGAVIAEEGTHQELMEQNGKYRELFEVQAKYYQEETASLRRDDVLPMKEREEG